MDYQFLVISNPEDKTDWWRVNNQNAPRVGSLLKNFLVAGLVDGILCFLGGQSIQQIHPNPIFDLFFKIYRTAGTSRGTLAWLITTAKAMVGSTPTSATNFQNGWGFSKRRILIRFVKWGQHPYQLPFQFFNKTICGVSEAWYLAGFIIRCLCASEVQILPPLPFDGPVAQRQSKRHITARSWV